MGALMLHISKIPSLKLSPEISYPGIGFSWFNLLSRQMPG
jgi:hypothetical protein